MPSCDASNTLLQLQFIIHLQSASQSAMKASVALPFYLIISIILDFFFNLCADNMQMSYKGESHDKVSPHSQ